ncbi:MAG: tRNA pseudouridine(38-40) synthase TruA [Erysipelotrichaceae bacterium]
MRYKAIVSYDGSKYNGWQKQPNVKSIQEEIEKSLSIIHKHPIVIVGSGRTDAKVHAIAQVFHFDSELNINNDHWIMAINSNLDNAIRIQSVELVKEDFHARFSVVSKRYDYYLSTNYNNPFIINYVGREYRKLNLEKMKECAKLFIGEHDFKTFTSSQIDERKSCIKTIYTLSVTYENGVYHFIFEGNGFLRYMVRNLVGTIVEVGTNKLNLEEVSRMLVVSNKHLCKFKADGEGLYLVKVNYESR